MTSHLTAKDFSAEEIARIQRVAQDTWQGIGSDICAANGGKYPSRAVIVEVTLDADHMLMSQQDRDETWPELYRKFKRLPYAAMKKMVRPVLS